MTDSLSPPAFHADRTLLPQGWERDVRLTVVDGCIGEVRTGVA
ncbi:hypothetical protein, partial [Streptococcus pneumoniae]